MKINSGTILIGFFAILCGLVGVHLYRQGRRPKPVVQQQIQAQQSTPAKSVVPMVSRDLLPGQKITIDDIALVRMTAEQRKATGLKKAYMTNPDQIIGQTVKISLRRGDTFDTRNFYPAGMGPGISHRLKPGFRALTIPMTPANALIGFAGAGQKVDVLFHYGNISQPNLERRPAKNQLQQIAGTAGMHRDSYGNQNSKFRGATSTVAQGVEILALNNGTTEANSGVGVTFENVMVTVAVTPQDAELLRVAMGHGELSLTLRSPSDKTHAIMPMPSTVDDLIHIEEPKVSQMEIFRGNSVSRLQFATNQSSRIKPKKIELPNLKIHIPSGAKQFQYNPSQNEAPTDTEQINGLPQEQFRTPPLESEQFDPSEFGSKSFDQQQFNDLLNQHEAPQIESMPIQNSSNRTPQVRSEPILEPSMSQSNRLQLDPNASYQNPPHPSEYDRTDQIELTNTQPTAPQITESAIPFQGNQTLPNVSYVEMESRPSLPGVRFAESAYAGTNPNTENQGMPASLMSSDRNDYREKFYRRSRSVGNGHHYSGSQRR